MLILLSPTKKQQTITSLSQVASTPLFIDQAKELASELSKLSPEQLMQCMKISAPLAQQVFDYYQHWSTAPKVAAVTLFTGEAFNALDPFTLSPLAQSSAQQSLRILSGLYGVLRPFDSIGPYRLEIAYKLPSHTNLYSFWKEKLTESLLEDCQNYYHQVIFNLASNEYSKAIDFTRFSIPVITPYFMEYKGEKLKTVAVFAKRARGAATRFLLEHRSNSADILKEFVYEGYQFDPNKSNDTQWYFIKGEPHVL